MKFYKTYIGGKWIETGKVLDVTEKYTGEIMAKVTLADKSTVDTAVEAAGKAFQTFRKMPAYERSDILEKTSDLILKYQENLAQTICREAGKAWKYSIGEVKRASETFKFAAEEDKTHTRRNYSYGCERIGYKPDRLLHKSTNGSNWSNHTV